MGKSSEDPAGSASPVIITGAGRPDQTKSFSSPTRRGQILDANESAAAAYGRDRRDLIGLNVSSLYAPEAVPPAAAPGQAHESLHMRADSSTFPVEIHTAGLEVAGKIFFLSVVQDISDKETR